MTYRELLAKCKNNPGCLAFKEQKLLDSLIRYKAWVAKVNEQYAKQKDKPENNL